MNEPTLEDTVAWARLIEFQERTEARVERLRRLIEVESEDRFENEAARQ